MGRTRAGEQGCAPGRISAGAGMGGFGVLQ